MDEAEAVNEAVNLRRAAEACRNVQRQAGARGDWFGWVPQHLDRLADRLDPRDPDDQGLAFYPRPAVTS